MRILFLTTFEVSPEKGGVERITSTLTRGLNNIYNVKCYSAYFEKINNNFELTSFEDKLHINKKNIAEDLRKFIVNNNINILINQGDFLHIHNIVKALEGLKTINITCHHFAPGAEENFVDIQNELSSIKEKKNLTKSILKLILFPLFKLTYNIRLKRGYKFAYQFSDKTILLSKKFICDYAKYANIKNKDKFYSIPNALSYESFFNMNTYENKYKEVLIVSRLDEKMKRLSIALKIWKEIEKDTRLNEWKLTIVGHGNLKDEKYYQSLVSKYHLNRVYFEGSQKPLKYYQRASIFLMTSKSEGWGITLTEAQQNGCVPIAFHSYSSLTEIINNDENGIIVPNNDIINYIYKLKQLMIYNDRRKYMAQKAINSSKRFKNKIIVKQWYVFLKNIQH